MKKIFYGFLALAGLAMVSCSQEFDEQINANTDSVKKIFTANTEDGASTRTSIALEEETGNYVVIWNGDEKIAVNGVDYKVIEGAGTKSVSFGADVEGNEAATAEVYNAVYPNDAWVEGGLDLEHLKEQTALNATYGHGYAVTVATTTDKEMDFKFKNALSFLRVRFSLAADAKEDAITIKTVKITANDNLWGTVSEVNYATGEIGAVANDSELGKSIVYTAGEDVVLDRAENAIFDAVIAVPVNTEGRTLTIEITGENAWTGTPYTYKAEGVTKKYLRNNVTTLAKAIKPVEVLLVADGVYKTAEDTFQIFNANGMKWLAETVSGGNSFANKTVQLIDNIDLSVFDNWTPIGSTNASAAPHFQGTFDGQGYTISGMTITERTNDAPQAALFCSVAGTATFKNFIMDDVNIVYPKDGKDFYGAALIGTYYGNVTIQDVTVQKSYISGNNKVAGIVAHDGSSSKLLIEGCKVLDSTIESTDEADGGCVGGVLGMFQQSTQGVENVIRNTTVSGCTIKGINSSDSGKRGNGLIVGSVSMGKANTTLIIENCTVEGNTFTNGNTNYVSPYGDGTLVGGSRNTVIGTVIIDGKTCIAEGVMLNQAGEYEISSEAGLKWLAAQVKEGNTFDGKTVKLTQNIALTEPWTPIGNNTDGVSKSFRGNFDGQNYTISDMVVNAGDAAAGFFGSKWDGDIKDVNFDNATITGSHYGGVVVGWADGANYNYNWTISGCEITNSTVTLAVENNDNGDKAGAVVGYAYAITVTENVVSNTTIQAYRDFGGIVGMAQENTTTDPHSECAVVSNNTIGENVKLIVDNTTNYQNYEIRSKYNVGQYVGRVSCHSVVDGNTGEATIEWGDIPAELVIVASVDGVEYSELSDALEAAASSSSKTVNVAAGEHEISGDIAEGLTIVGVMDGEDYLTTIQMPDVLNAENVTIKDMKITQPLAGEHDVDKKVSAIRLNGCGTFENCYIEGYNAFYMGYSLYDMTGDVYFKDCVLKATWAYCISTGGTGNVYIEGCDLYGWNSFSKTGKVTITNSTINSNGTYCKLRFYDAAEVTGSTLADDVSIDFMNYPSTTSVDGKEITFTGNTFNGNLIDAVDTSCFASASPIFTIDGVQYVGTDAQLEAALAQDVEDLNIYLCPGTYNFGGLSIAPATVTIKGADKAGVVINMNESIYLSGKTVNFENLTYTAPAGLGYTEQAFAFVHHAAGFNFDNCVINRLRLNVASATIKNSTFEVITNSGFDGYGLYYYGNDKSNVTVQDCVFNTTGKAICVYSESAKEYNLTVNDTQFYSSNTSTDKAAVSIHAEYGIYGTLTMNRCEATGFIANNNGLWRELNNNTKVDTKNFTKVIDGVLIEDITGGFGASADGEVVVW